MTTLSHFKLPPLFTLGRVTTTRESTFLFVWDIIYKQSNTRYPSFMFPWLLLLNCRQVQTNFTLPDEPLCRTLLMEHPVVPSELGESVSQDHRWSPIMTLVYSRNKAAGARTLFHILSMHDSLSTHCKTFLKPFNASSLMFPRYCSFIIWHYSYLYPLLSKIDHHHLNTVHTFISRFTHPQCASWYMGLYWSTPNDALEHMTYAFGLTLLYMNCRIYSAHLDNDVCSQTLYVMQNRYRLPGKEQWRLIDVIYYWS